MTDVAAQYDSIKRVIGECVAAWSAVERSVTWLYCECVTKEPMTWTGVRKWTDQEQFHASIFESVISFDARLDMVSAALQWHCARVSKTHPELATPLLERWVKLQKRLLKKYKKRHQVAHADFKQVNRNGKHVVTLVPFSGVSLDVTKEPGLSISELQERRDMFDRLPGEVFKFGEEALEVLRLSQ